MFEDHGNKKMSRIRANTIGKENVQIHTNSQQESSTPKVNEAEIGRNTVAQQRRLRQNDDLSFDSLDSPARKKGNIKLKKTLDQARENQKKKQKEELALEKKKAEVREETKALIKNNTGTTIKCPDCGSFYHHGSSLIIHRTRWCKQRKF